MSWFLISYKKPLCRMLKLIVFLFLPIFLIASDSFITKYEYGKMLYKNPRGIGCNQCHGESGEGQIIATYKHKKEIREIKAPPINSLEKDEFLAAFNKKNKIMPKYHLTEMELEALYEYLIKAKNSVNRNK